MRLECPVWQALSETVKAAAVTELRDGFALEEKAGEIVVLRKLLEMLPRTFLHNLGSEKEVRIARQPRANRKHYATLETNLLSVVCAAFPSCTVEENETGRGGWKGLYINGLLNPVDNE